MGIIRSSANPHNSDDDVKRRAYCIGLKYSITVFTTTVTIRNVLPSSLFPFEDELSTALANMLSKNSEPLVLFQEPI